LDRVQIRKIPASQLELLATWLDDEREAPAGLWYKRFSGMTFCGEGELVKTFLLPGQTPTGGGLLKSRPVGPKGTLLR